MISPFLLAAFCVVTYLICFTLFLVLLLCFSVLTYCILSTDQRTTAILLYKYVVFNMMTRFNLNMVSLSHIIPVPRSGDLSKPDNCCGISQTCVIAKIHNRMILNRIQSGIDPHLKENQNGFWERRTTLAQILALQRIIQEVKRNNLTAELCFIDFENAFDSVYRGRPKMFHPTYSEPLRPCAQEWEPKLDSLSKYFNIQIEVLETLASFLFIIVLDYTLRQSIRRCEQELGFTITPRRSTTHPAHPSYLKMAYKSMCAQKFSHVWIHAYTLDFF